MKIFGKKKLQSTAQGQGISLEVDKLVLRLTQTYKEPRRATAALRMKSQVLRLTRATATKVDATGLGNTEVRLHMSVTL